MRDRKLNDAFVGTYDDITRKWTGSISEGIVETMSGRESRFFTKDRDPSAKEYDWTLKGEGLEPSQKISSASIPQAETSWLIDAFEANVLASGPSKTRQIVTQETGCSWLSLLLQGKIIGTICETGS